MSVTVGWLNFWCEIYLFKLVNIFVQIGEYICPNCKMYIWWNNFKISCLCLSQLVGSTADVKTLPNGFFHISQSATSDFFWIFLYLMPQVFADTPPPLLQHTQILHKQEIQIEQYQIWGLPAIFGIWQNFYCWLVLLYLGR